jgi:hypothetical protein
MEEVMLRNLASSSVTPQLWFSSLLLPSGSSIQHGGSQGHGRASNCRVKEDKAKALDMFNKGAGGFKDRDLYASCANASDGM